MSFKQYDRYVLDWATGELYVEKAIEVVYNEGAPERVAQCSTCTAPEEFGIDACCGCAG
jgi:hypothetical protein